MNDPDSLYRQVGDLIRARRKDAGITQEELAERIGLTRTSINNFEKGRQRIQLHTLFDLAKALTVPPTELLPRATESGTRAATARMLHGLRKEVRAWVAEMSVLEGGTQPLVDLIEGVKQIRSAVAKRKTSGLQPIDLCVSALLETLSKTEPPVPIEQMVQRLGVSLRYRPCSVEVACFSLEQEHSAIIGINSAQPVSRQRFGIAHALGHLLLHPSDGLRLDMNFSDASDPSETHANEFASKLLIPSDWLRRDLGQTKVDFENAESITTNLAKRYKVSRQVLGARLLALSEVQG